MIQHIHPVWQALLAGLFTWGVTALGAALVFIPHPKAHAKKILDTSLGFAAGVMSAASFWSLLAPAIDIAERSVGQWATLTIAAGFTLGAGFVFAADRLIPTSLLFPATTPRSSASTSVAPTTTVDVVENPIGLPVSKLEEGKNHSACENVSNHSPADDVATSWRRIFLLVVAITAHNIPEGLAVGIGFGSIGRSETATFQTALNLAIGIGLQNFPEGLAVSMPLSGFGCSKLRAFMYGQMSGLVEPFFAVIGAAVVILVEPILPYGLSFAAGAMMFVVVDDIIPEAHRNGNGKLVSFGAMVGFVVMMSLEVGLG
uniref:Zinc transporter ZIP11 n=1 Tax=Plectus sambesii TaxID=2011161 RepID=A0A914WVI5_9BILA